MSGEQASLFDLDFHEVAEVNNSCQVMRVPNGWIYDFATHSCFVPEYLGNGPQQENKDVELLERVAVLLNKLESPDEQVTIDKNRIVREILRAIKQ